MASLNAIRTLTVRAKPEGFPETTSALKGLQSAHDGVARAATTSATVTDVASKRQLSIAEAYRRQTLALDENARMQDKIARATLVADKALQQGAITQREYAQRLDLIRQRFTSASAANDNFAKSTGLARHEMVNLSRQVQDIGVSLASGQSPFTVLVQQGTQVADIFGNSQGTIRGFGAQIASLITPMRALALGVAAAGAVAIAATLSWKSYALALDDTAKQAGITSSEMAKLQAAASFKGIGNDDFAKAMGAFSQNVYEAKNNMGGLAEVFRANGMNAKDFNSSLEQAADLIKNASSDQQRLVMLQQMGLPATMQWVRLMSQGAAGIREAKKESGELNGINDAMVAKAREFDEMWNKFTTKFGQAWKTAILDVIGFFDRLSDAATAAIMRIPGIGKNVPTNLLKAAFADGMGGSRFTQSQADEFYAATGAGGGTRLGVNGRATVDPNALKQQLALEQQRIGILGQLATVADQVRQKEIEIALARLNGVKVTKEEEKAILEHARAQAIGLDQIRAQTDALTIETATIGMSTANAVAYRLVWEKVYEAKRRGAPLNEEQIRELQREAEIVGRLTQMNAGLRQLEQAASSAFSGLVSDITSGVDAMDSLIRHTAQLGKQLTDIGSKSLFDSLKSGLSGNGFSFDPVSLGIGAVGLGMSLISNLLKGNKEAEEKARKEQEEAQQNWVRLGDSVREFNQAASGVDLNPIVRQLMQVKKTADELILAGMKAGAPTAGLHSSFSSQVNNAVMNFAYGALNPMSELGKKLVDITNGAGQLRDELNALGITLENAPWLFAAIADGMEKQIWQLRDQYTAQIEARNNSALGKDYLNEFASALTSWNEDVRTAIALGLDRTATDVAYINTLQKVIDSNKLNGASYDELIAKYPQFASQLHAFTEAAEGAAEAVKRTAEELANLSRQLDDELFGATNDSSTQAGQIAALDREFAQRRADEAAAGGEMLAKIEAIYGAKRLSILEQFAEAALARQRSYEDRLFAAQNDPNTLTGALSAAQRKFAQEQLAEQQAGGQAMSSLIAAQMAEQFNIQQDFAKRAIEAEQETADKRTEAVNSALQDSLDFIAGFRRNIDDFINHFNASPASLLSPQQQLTNAQSAFDAQLGIIDTGTAEERRAALNSITSYAQDLIDANKAFYGSTATGQTNIQDVLAQLGALPDQVSPEQLIVNAISDASAAQVTAANNIISAVDLMKTTLQTAVNSGSAANIATALSGYFNTLDVNTDGLLTESELHNVLTAADVATILKTVDTDNSGSIDQLELIKAATETAATASTATATNTTGVGTATAAVATNTTGVSTNIATTATNTGSTASALGGSGDPVRTSLEQIANTTEATSQNTFKLQDMYVFEEAMRLMMVQQNANWKNQTGGGGIPTFHTGGLVGGYGEVSAKLLSGEGVLNRSAMSNLGVDFLNAANNGRIGAAVNDNREILAELRELRAEVARLRTENNRANVAIIQSSDKGNESLEAVVEHSKTNAKAARRVA